MALRVTDSIETSGGATTGLYFHITEYYRNKEGKSQFPVKYFFDETTDEEGARQDVSILVGDLKMRYDYELTELEIGSDKIEKLAYDKIAEELKTAGLNVESDESGSWLAV